MKTEPTSDAAWRDIAREATAKLDAKNYIWMRHMNEIQAIVLDAIKKAHRQWMDGSPSLPSTTIDAHDKPLVDALEFYSCERMTRDQWDEHVQFDYGKLALETLAKVKQPYNGSPDTLCRCDKLKGEHYESEHPQSASEPKYDHIITCPKCGGNGRVWNE